MRSGLHVSYCDLLPIHNFVEISAPLLQRCCVTAGNVADNVYLRGSKVETV